MTGLGNMRRGISDMAAEEKSIMESQIILRSMSAAVAGLLTRRITRNTRLTCGMNGYTMAKTTRISRLRLASTGSSLGLDGKIEDADQDWLD